MKQAAMIIGTGSFGKNYVRVMAELNRRAAPAQKAPAQKAPVLDPLIVTRTLASAAQETAAEIKRTFGNAFSSVIGVKIDGVGSLQKALEAHRPALIGISARDRKIGDDIHAVYAPIALNHGAVLCEKPFSGATGDGASLEAARLLQAHPFAHRFAMHLPMAVVLRAMIKDNRLGPLLAEADDIDFVWQKQHQSPDLICDLVLHPWSLMPAWERLSVERVTTRHAEVEIHLRWARPGKARDRKGRIILNSKGLFRGMRINDTVLQFDFLNGQLVVMALEGDWHGILAGEQSAARTNVLLRVDNPLAQHLQALLEGQPVVDGSQTFRSQFFLEILKGYPIFSAHRQENKYDIR
jgi:hypothetical protein